MAGEVLYRKWRPQTFHEVVGQETVTTTLRNAVRAGRVGHAYLFSGPRGTGKTSTGRILAKAVNCLDPQGGEPCNRCEACVSITEGRCLDVVEIDAASNRGIDDIRNLRERVGYAAGTVRRKVYIIDEVHMLTDPASNALLKTLEEPPPHVMFVLATTELHKVLPTIISRCQSFNFRRLGLSSVVSKLETVAGQEGVHASENSLVLVARAAGGSLRDAENLLQQLVASHGVDLAEEEVRAALGVADRSLVLQLVSQIVTRDVEAALRAVHAASQSGMDLRHFGRETVCLLRSLLLIRSGCADIVEVGDEAAGQNLGRLALRLHATLDDDLGVGDGGLDGGLGVLDVRLGLLRRVEALHRGLGLGLPRVEALHLQLPRGLGGIGEDLLDLRKRLDVRLLQGDQGIKIHGGDADRREGGGGGLGGHVGSPGVAHAAMHNS